MYNMPHNNDQLYHFVVESPLEKLIISEAMHDNACKYLKNFQIEALRFLSGHLAADASCILNDESGLGKKVTIAGLLSVYANKKCLIVVDDDEQALRWQFHFDVLTNLTVCIAGQTKIQNKRKWNVCIAKWTTLLHDEDWCKQHFDYVLVDNRGCMLENTFCMSMLLKNYEKRVNLLISNVDITSNLKLMHNMLRLCGRLKPPYVTFKSFEHKFKLPSYSELLPHKKVDLEEYFLKRKMLSDYCKSYRLRRYRHQYETILPLVKHEDFRRNLYLWQCRIKSNNTQTTETRALFAHFLNCKEQQLMLGSSSENEQSSIDNNDEPISLSPLLFASDSETDNVLNNAMNDIDKHISKVLAKITTVPATRQDSVEVLDLTRESQEINEKVQDKCMAVAVSDKVVENRANIELKKLQVRLKRKHIQKQNNLETQVNDTQSRESTKKKTTPTLKCDMSQSNKQIEGLKKILGHIPEAKPRKNSCQIPNTVQHKPIRTSINLRDKITRSMQRTTRASSVKHKYATRFQLDMNGSSASKSRKRRKNHMPKQRHITESNNNNNCKAELSIALAATTKVTNDHSTNDKKALVNKRLKQASQLSIILPPLTESEEIQCAQKLPCELNTVDSAQFIMPVAPIPAAHNIAHAQWTPLSLFTESDVLFAPATNSATNQDVIELSSSQDECATHSCTQSRRTCALKRKKTAVNTQSALGDILNSKQQMRIITRSPDLFSNCSEIGIAFTQAGTNSNSNNNHFNHNSCKTFAGFKVFDSEVKTQTQKTTTTTQVVVKNVTRSRSCLDILEQIFEPRANVLRGKIPNAQILNDDDIFETTTK